MRLTEHFTLSEFTNSSVAKANHIDNTIPEDLIPNLKNLCEQILEPLRQHFGVLVIISSGYRCPALNRAVGGVPNSQHLKGEAADIVMPDIKEAFYWLLDNTHFDQLILEQDSKGSNWVHVSCKLDPTKNRRQILRINKRV